MLHPLITGRRYNRAFFSRAVISSWLSCRPPPTAIFRRPHAAELKDDKLWDTRKNNFHTKLKTMTLYKWLDPYPRNSFFFIGNYHSCCRFSILILAGCACRFLYGPETKDEHKGQIEKSLDGKLELKLEVIFYKKNGECAAHLRVIFFGQQQLLIRSVEFLNWNVVNDLLSLGTSAFEICSLALWQTSWSELWAGWNLG